MAKYLKDRQTWSHEFATDLCFTLGQRRAHWPYRAAFAARDVSTLRKKLVTCEDSKDGRFSKAGEPFVIFVFTGQGAQYAEMAMGLFNYPAFAAAMREADRILGVLGASFSVQEEVAKP